MTATICGSGGGFSCRLCGRKDCPGHADRFTGTARVCGNCHGAGRVFFGTGGSNFCFSCEGTGKPVHARAEQNAHVRNVPPGPHRNGSPKDGA